MADRDEDVLQGGPAAVVGVDVPGRDAGDAEPLRERNEIPVARPVPTPERPLQLDPEAVGPERPGQPLADRLSSAVLTAGDPPRQGAVAGAAGEADEPLGVALELAAAGPTAPAGPRRGRR